MGTSIVDLGRLEKISLRQAWPDEAQNFTPWLAEDTNLSLLGETLGIQLELEAVEKQVGPFAADILAKEMGSDRWVLIENQIEPTDHRHLGQLLTYAAGLDARTIIWIAESFREEHRAAIDFLNRATTEDFAFFGVQVELYRIGLSDPAPRFSLVGKPNNWSKRAQAAKQVAEGELTPTQLLSRQFWSQLIAKASTAFPPLAVRSPYKSSWQAAERLFSNPQLYVDANVAFTATGRLRVEIYIGNRLAKAAFRHLVASKAEIEAAFGADLEWEELPQGQDSRIAFYMPGEQKRETKQKWSEQQDWILQNLPKLSGTFRPLFAKLDIAALAEEEEQATEEGLSDEEPVSLQERPTTTPLATPSDGSPSSPPATPSLPG